MHDLFDCDLETTENNCKYLLNFEIERDYYHFHHHDFHYYHYYQKIY